MTHAIYKFPKEDQATAILFLKSLEQSIDEGKWCTENVVANLWHCVFEGEWTRRGDGSVYYHLTGGAKLSNPSLRWAVEVGGRDFLATLLFWMDEDTQSKITGRWQTHVQERSELLAGLRRWQVELKGLWHQLMRQGWINRDLKLLSEVAA